MVEFLLGRYGASTDPAEIEEGLQIVEKQHQGRTVRTGEEELFKARARDQGSVKIIDRLVLVGLVIVRQSDGHGVSFRDLSKESGELQGQSQARLAHLNGIKASAKTIGRALVKIVFRLGAGGGAGDLLERTGLTAPAVFGG